MKTTTNCPVCQKEFTRTHIPTKQPIHCSRACANKSPGRMTPEIRSKVGRKGEANSNYRGGWKREAGYIVIGKTPRSHIVWDATHPDNPFQKGEIIHHINGVKDDDRPENLEKMTQSEHIKLHGIPYMSTDPWKNRRK